MDIRALVDSAKAKGLAFFLDGDRIRVEAPTEPDPETKTLLEQLRGHRDELKSMLAAPSLTPEDREEAKKLAVEAPPPCWNCGQSMTDTHDINGKAWWACWKCARWV